MLSTDVLVAGGGPCGLMLANELGQRGIRSIERIGNSYLIVAGPPADTGSFALYRWTGVPGDPARQVPGADLGDLFSYFAIMFDRTAHAPQVVGQPVWNFETGLKVARALERAGAYWLEEPYARDDFQSPARLAAMVDLPITGGEGYAGVRDETLVGRERLAGGILSPGVSITDAYAAAMADIGVRVQTAQAASTISASVAGDAETARANTAGVNLDEEAARLIQYQQTYQAAAKVIQVAQAVFDTLLQTMAR